MSTAAQGFLAVIQQALGARGGTAEFVGNAVMASNFAMTDLGCAALAAAGLAIAELSGNSLNVVVDRALATGWFHRPSLSLASSAPPRRGFNPLSSDFPTKDGHFVRFQANYPHLRAATLRALGTQEDLEAVTAFTLSHTGDEIERIVVDGGGAAAVTRTREEWHTHPQGVAVGQEPVAHVDVFDQTPPLNWHPIAGRPLAALKVLDVTRVLAGPIATRFLAAYGAEVLHIDPDGYDEPMGVGNGDIMLGKRNARLQLNTPDGRTRFLELLSEAHVLVHGLRADALEKLGLGQAVRQAVRPGLIEVTLNAYGWSGPWVMRRGFDTLIQASDGMALAGGQWQGQDKPFRWPLSILDHATGYLMAAAAIRGVTRRLETGKGSRSRFSLARTGELLMDQVPNPDDALLELPVTGPWEPRIASGPNGPVRRLLAPLSVLGADFYFDRPGDPFRTSEPVWIGV